MKSTKLGTIFLVSIMALAGVTIGYAAWSETLTIDGDVTTGTFDVDFIAGPTHSDVTAEVGESILWVNITNAYPGVIYYANFDIKNVGSVPAEFTTWTYTLGGMPSGSSVNVVDDAGPIQNTVLYTNDLWGGNVTIEIGESADHSTLYTFSVETTASQYVP
jgi:hypothetical protein